MGYTVRDDIEELNLPKKLKKHIAKKVREKKSTLDIVYRHSWTCPKCLKRNKLLLPYYEACSQKCRYQIRLTAKEIYPKSMTSQCNKCFHISFFKKPCKYSKWLFVFESYFSGVTKWRKHIKCKRQGVSK